MLGTAEPVEPSSCLFGRGSLPLPSRAYHPSISRPAPWANGRSDARTDERLCTSLRTPPGGDGAAPTAAAQGVQCLSKPQDPVRHRPGRRRDLFRLPQGRVCLRVSPGPFDRCTTSSLIPAVAGDSTRTDWSASNRNSATAASEAQSHRPSRSLQPRPSPRGGFDRPWPGPERPGPRVAPEREPAVNSPESAVSRFEEADHLARTALSRFFQNGIDFSDWHVFQVADDFRLAYIGTAVSNLSHLADLRRSQGATGPGGRGAAPQSQGDGDALWQQFLVAPSVDVTRPSACPASSLHYPYPQIRPLTLGRPPAPTLLDSPQDLASDLSSFPVQETREALVRAYFEHIHPVFPLLTPSTFLHSDGTLRSSPPLLLYQAVLLAGAQVCSHPRVEHERSLLKSVLFRRAGMLYHLRHEKDRLHLTQAALLFTWHINDGDTVAGGPWYWTGVALRVSCAQGAHRHNAHLPTFERIMYKRSFWCAFVAEAFSALETGRPCAVRPEDVDQSLPTEAELEWDQRQNTSRLDLRVEEQEQEPALAVGGMPFAYHQHMIELAFIVMDLLTLSAPSTTQRPTVPSIEGRLALWSLRAGLAAVDAGEDFFRSQLRLYYNLVVLNLHRNYRKNSDDSQKTCTTAAESILASLERIAALGLMGRCHFPVVIAVTAAGIQLVQDIRATLATNAYLVCLNHLERLARMIGCAKLLAQFWPNAEAVHQVFEGLREEYEDQIQKALDPDEVPCVSASEPPWDSLFASMQAPDVEQTASAQEWLDLNAWAESL